MCREADLVEYFLHTQEFDKDAWTILFYTGQRQLVLSRHIFERNSKLLVCKGRPKLEEDLLAVMHAIESGGMLPQRLLDQARDMYGSLFGSVRGRVGALLQRALLTYPGSELWELAIDFSIEAERTAKSEHVLQMVEVKQPLSLEVKQPLPLAVEQPSQGHARGLKQASSLEILNSGNLLKRVEERRREMGIFGDHCVRHRFASGSRPGQNSPGPYPSTPVATSVRQHNHPLSILQNTWAQPADCEVRGCSVDGFEQLIQFLVQDTHVLDDVMDDVLELFSIFLAGSRALNKAEFHQAIASLTDDADVAHSSHSKDTTSRMHEMRVYTERMRGALTKEILKSQKDLTKCQGNETLMSSQQHVDFGLWQVLYCGGAKPVVTALQAMHKKYHFALEIESFAW